MHVVIDTCAIRLGFDLVGRVAETYLFATRAKKLVACFPEIVVLEMLRQFREALTDAHQKFEAARAKMELLTGQQQSGVLKLMMDIIWDEHESKLRARIGRYGAKVQSWRPARES